jgi:PIN domain nuclease of toxin-antitoxin system
VALLLDTCAVVFIATGERIAETALTAVMSAARSDGVWVSPISAWEIGMLAAKGRMSFEPDPKTWILRFLAREGVALVPVAVEAAVDASGLPQTLPRDPVDRLLVATARHLGVPLVTRDRAILAHARAGHLKAIAC